MSTPGAKNNKFFYENKHLPSVFLQRKMARKFYKNQSHREPLAHKYAITITIQQLKRRLKEAQIKVHYSTANDPQPQMIPRRQMIPKMDRKWSPTASDP